nr:hypothetical protein [Mycoplasmatota bacterium]
MNFHIYVKGNTKSGNYEIKGILSTYYKLPNVLVKKLGGKKKALEYYKKKITKDKIEKVLIPSDRMFSTVNITEYEIVSVIKRQWVHGEYYAHEYAEDEYCEGKGRKIIYSNGYTEYEIRCLDSTKSVMDGIWDKSDIGSSRIGNGCGDHFSPFERGL